MTQLIEQKLIEQLVSKRSLLLENMNTQFKAVREAYELARQMDDLIPTHPAAHIDYFDIVFTSLQTSLGESKCRLMPKNASILSMSLEDLNGLFTRILDETLWSILFNRLNIYSIMSKSAVTTFREQLKVSPLVFDRSNVEVTLKDILARQDEILIQSLMDSVLQGADQYASNDKFKFNKRTVFKEVLNTNPGYICLDKHSHFKDTLCFLSRIAYPRDMKVNKSMQITHPYLWQLVLDYFDDRNVKDISESPVFFEGGRIEFWKNGNSHLYLSEQLVNQLNGHLGKTRSLMDAA